MSRFAIDDQEMDALYGLRYGAKALYFFLRGRMNFSTGEVGRKPLISRWTLREALFIEPKRGRAAVDSGTPSEKEVRGYEQELEQAGLIEYRSISNQKQLIFFLSLATKSAPPSHEVGQVSPELGQSYVGHEQTKQQQGFAVKHGHEEGHGETCEQGHTSGTGVSGKNLNPSLTSSSRVSAAVVKAGDAEAQSTSNTNPKSELPAVPVEVWQWKVKVLRSGFDAMQARSPKAMTQYVQWCADRVSQAEYDAALVQAVNFLDEMPGSPCYLVDIIEQQRAAVAPAKYGSAKNAITSRVMASKGANRAIGGLSARLEQQARENKEYCVNSDEFEETPYFTGVLQ